MFGIMKNTNDCRTDMIGRGGNRDVCPGRQTPLRRHCYYGAVCTSFNRQL